METAREVKLFLARTIVAMYHGEEAAQKAQEEWISVHSFGDLPSQIPDRTIPAECIESGRVWIVKLLTALGLAQSNREARRLIIEGGVKLNTVKVTDPGAEEFVYSLDNSVLQVGKKRYVRLKVG